MDLKAILKQVIRQNLGYLIYLFIVNAFILNNFYHMELTKPFKKMSSYNIDGSNFAVIINFFESLFNFGLILLSFALTFILVLISNIIFNGFYFKSKSDIEMVRRIKDIRIITVVFSCLSISLLIILFSGLTKVYGLFYYVPFPLLIYLLVKNKLKKSVENKKV
jgi:hypothetical protein